MGVIRYDFSFTAASLRRNETMMVANDRVHNQKSDLGLLIGGGKSTTGKRILRECNKRIDKLTSKEIWLLLNGDLITQNQMAFLAVCKLHAFIRDFVVEVVREKLLVFDYQLSEGEYISFFRRKEEEQPEMENLSELTQNKVRQVTFKILEQAGIIDTVKTKVIQPQILDDKVSKAIVSDDAEWLKVFLMSDMDIQNFNT